MHVNLAAHARKRIAAFALLLLLPLSVLAAQTTAEKTPQPTISTTPNSTAEHRPLRVAVAGTRPFVVQTGDDWSGVSIDIWREIANGQDWQYTFKPYRNVSDALQALSNEEVDLVVGPVSITSARAEQARFSQPYYQSSLSILSRSDEPNVWQRIKPFFSLKLLAAVSVLLCILACVGTLLWLVEHKTSPEQFPRDLPHGIGNGMWCAIVTMTTTGYGDIAPKTLLGRIIAAGWMIISIIFATSMIAGIASTLTLTGMSNVVIATADELQGKSVAVLQNSPASRFVDDLNGTQVDVQNFEQGYQLLKNSKVDAVVFDRPQMLYFLEHHKDNHVAVSYAEYLKQGYGFAFPLDTDLVHSVNIQLLHMGEDGSLKRVVEDWLGADPAL